MNLKINDSTNCAKLKIKYKVLFRNNLAINEYEPKDS